MSTPQSAILPEASQHALYMVIKVTYKSDKLIKQCAAFPALIETIKTQNNEDSLFASLGFGADYWDAIHPGSRPQRLKTFTALGEGDVSAPATGGDIFLHIHSGRKDMNYLLASEFLKPIKESISVLEEIDGFHIWMIVI